MNNFFNPLPEASFSITDDCNLRCKNCHWFSQPITVSNKIKAKDVINWLSIHGRKLSKIKITGGEPTLHPEFLEMVTGIAELRLPYYTIINTNGTNVDIIRKIPERCFVYFGINRTVDNDHLTVMRTLPVPKDFISYHQDTYGKPLKDEVQFGQSLQKLELVGNPCICTPRSIRFASDGNAYYCEVGLRTKQHSLQCNFSLWSGFPNLDSHPCVIKSECLSGFLNENSYLLLKKV